MHMCAWIPGSSVLVWTNDYDTSKDSQLIWSTFPIPRYCFSITDGGKIAHLPPGPSPRPDKTQRNSGLRETRWLVLPVHKSTLLSSLTQEDESCVLQLPQMPKLHRVDIYCTVFTEQMIYLESNTGFQQDDISFFLQSWRGGEIPQVGFRAGAF